MTIDLRKLPLSEKQIQYVCESNLFVNLAEGAIRSGKTASGLLRWLMYIADPKTPTNGDLVVCAKTYDTAVRNIFNPLRDWRLFGPLSKATSYTRGASTARILGQTIEVITFNNEGSESRLRGMTCRGAYVDEWTLMPQSFHEQLLARLSLDGSQVFGNTNPDNPMHWLKTEGIDEAGPGGRLHGDWYVLKFGLDDNPALSDRVKARYHRQYTGMWHRRMILGDWCMAAGAIYASWDPERHVVKDAQMPTIRRWISLGVDYGNAVPFAGLVLGVGANGKLYLCREWRWDPKKRMEELTDAQYSERLRKSLKDWKIDPEWYCVDPSAASFKRQLFHDGITNVMDAENGVMDGIRLVASLISEGLLLVHESCKGWLLEAPAYSWDDEKALEGIDEPIKRNDHSLDAGRYAIATTDVMWRPYIRHDFALAA